MAPDWAQKMLVLLCLIGEQYLLSSFREFVRDGYCLTILVRFVHQGCARKGSFHFLKCHGKMEFNSIPFSFFVFRSRMTLKNRFEFYFRFRITLKNGCEFHFSFFVFASLWNTEVNFVFRFDMACYWKTDLNFLCRFCKTLKNVFMHQSFESPGSPTPPLFPLAVWPRIIKQKTKQNKKNKKKASGFENIERTNRSLGSTSMKILPQKNIIDPYKILLISVDKDLFTICLSGAGFFCYLSGLLFIRKRRKRPPTT